MVIADYNFRGHVNVLIYTALGGKEFFGFRATQVQKESDV